MSQARSKTRPQGRQAAPANAAAPGGGAAPQGAWLLVVHDAALLLAIFYTPIYWGTFATAGQALAAALVAMAALAALAWRVFVRGSVAVIPNAIHLPALAFICISAVCALFSTSAHSSALELSRLVTGALLFALIANRALLPAAPAKPVAVLLGLSLIYAWGVKTSGELGSALDLLTTLGLGAVAAFLLLGERKPDPVRRSVEALVLCAGLAIAIYGIREKIITYYFMEPRNTSWQIFATFFNKNMLGGFLAFLVPLALGVALTAARLWQRILWAVLALVTAATLYPTYSKGSELSLLIGLALFGLLAAWASRRPGRNAGLALGAYLLAAAAVRVALHASPALKAKVLEAFSDQTSSNMFRILTWKGTLKMALHNPIVGIGPGAFKSVYTNYTVAGYTEAAHQNYLHVAAEQGFPGLLVFLWLLGAILYTGWRVVGNREADRSRRLLAAAGLASLIVFMAHSLLDYDWYIGAIMLSVWTVAGVLAHLAHGRNLPVAAVEQVPEPAKGKRPRGGEPQAKLAPERDVHRLPWPKGSVAQWIGVLAVTALLGFSFWTAERSALAERAVELGEGAVTQRDAAMTQQDRELALQYQDEATILLAAAAGFDPGWREAHEKLGVVLDVQGIGEIQKAIALEPRNYQPYLSLARVQEGAKHYTQAAEAFEQSLRLYPGNTRALRFLAQTYREMGRESDALRTYQRLADLEGSLAARYPAIAVDVDVNYAYADYELAKAEVARYRSDHRREHLTTAFMRIQKAEAWIGKYFARNSGYSLDLMFASIGKPRQLRALDLVPLLIKVCELKAEAFDLWGNRAANAAEARRQAQEAPARYAVYLAGLPVQ